jgi:hypothetical protein
MISDENRRRRIEAIDRTIEKMERAKTSGFEQLGFDMTNWFARNAAHDCGTAACIAGWVVHANSNFAIDDLVEIGRGRYGGIPDRATELLRLSREQAGKLFFAEENEQTGLAFDKITIEHAIAVLAHLRDTDEVRWQVLDDLPALQD